MTRERLHPCPDCPRYHPPIPGNGPVPCSIMVIGEGPARRELENQARQQDKLGWPLVGDSGAEYNQQYLPLAGLTRESVYTTNIAKCTTRALENPSMERAAACADYHLHSELRVVKPDIIVTLGAIALHTLFPGHDLTMEHGRPFAGSWCSWEGIVVPMYHPAAGLHNAGRFMSMMREDWTRLGSWLDGGEWGESQDLYPSPDYQECKGPADVDQYMGALPDTDIAMDTEVKNMTAKQPYCMSFSHTSGTARVVRAENTPTLGRLEYWVRRLRLRIILHNAGFDPTVLGEMGITVQPDRFSDTMMMAYHLGYLPQSLKVLAYRLCGMRMMEFEDVAGPPSREEVMEWLVEARRELYAPPAVAAKDRRTSAIHMIAADFFTPDMNKTARKKMWKEALTGLGQDLLVYRGAPVACREEDVDYLPPFLKFVNALKTGNEKAVQRVDSLLNALLDKPDDTDPWRRWKEWDDGVCTQILTAAGEPMPELSIVHVPWNDAMYYSARDADATIRILPHLRRMIKGVGRVTL